MNSATLWARRLVLVIGVAVYTEASVAQDRPISVDPFAAAPPTACVGFCQILTKEEKDAIAQAMGIDLRGQVLTAIGEQRRSSELQSLVGEELTDLGTSVSDLGKLPLPAPWSIVVKTTSKLLSRAGKEIVKDAERNLSKRILLELDKANDKIIAPDGTINRDELAHVTENDLRFVYSPQFQMEVQAPELIALAQNKITAQQLSAVLQDTGKILETQEQLKQALGQQYESLQRIEKLQLSLVTHAVRTNERLTAIETKINQQQQVVNAIAVNNLPPSQVAALARAGALGPDIDQAALDRAADIDEIRQEFSDAAGFFRDSANALASIGLAEPAAFMGDCSRVLDSAGSFAVAWAAGDPISIGTSALGFVGALKSFGGKPRESGEARMLRAIFQKLVDIENLIRRNHAEEMQKLAEISMQIAALDALAREKFGEILYRSGPHS